MGMARQSRETEITLMALPNQYRIITILYRTVPYCTVLTLTAPLLVTLEI